jgi:hypothetical protein
MAKKQRRSTHRITPAPVAATTEGFVSRPTTAKTATAKVDLAQEYHYVFADLRKIAVIAVAMFVLLFVLAFVLK